MSQTTTQTDGGTDFQTTIERIAADRDDTAVVYVNARQDEGDTFADLNVDGDCVPTALLAELADAHIDIHHANEVAGEHLTCLTVAPCPGDE